MKYGLVMHTKTSNFGDDIQSYAISRFLPRIDYYLDREELDSFAPADGEPVAVVMAAWWLWKKWNWPPSDAILPLLTSMHINNDTIEYGASPAMDAWVQGIGGDYLRAYGPVGARDLFSLRFFEERGIPSYFSGCITLTLPKQPRTEDAGTYVCLVDLPKKVKEKACRMAESCGLRVVEMTHNCKGISEELSEAARLKRAEEYLRIYQNAKLVVTRRLHVTLPCLAMETPVLAVVDPADRPNINRWDAYAGFVTHATAKEFLADDFRYDMNHPLPNDTGYLPLREGLIRQVSDFLRTAGQYAPGDISWRKTSYTEGEALAWRYAMMKDVLSDWLIQNREQIAEKNQLKKEIGKLQKETEKRKKAAEKRDTEIQALKTEIQALRAENERLICQPEQPQTPFEKTAEEKQTIWNRLWKNK